MSEVREMLVAAKTAARKFMNTSGEKRNEALFAIAEALEDQAEAILAANDLDIEAAKEKIGEVMIDRLRLTKERIAGIAKGVREVAALPDPLARNLQTIVRPNGLKIEKIAVPLGVVAIIYESRPNVTADAAALCIKSGNVCVLRGGSNAYRTSAKIVGIMKVALVKVGLDENLVNMPTDTSRQSATELMTAVGLVDVLIPRGGAGLIRSCVENAKVPCIETGTGICHLYIDESAELDTALNLVENAKTSRPSVCNAEEVCLVHRSIANAYLPALKARLVENRIADGKPPVELRLCERAQKIVDGVAATETDFDTEFLDYILAVKIVDSVQEAIEHIAAHSTGHSDGIVTRSEENARAFVAGVDSAAVYVNASTRFTDGGEFGKGCEIGISTQKMHARGPMGLEELTTYKYVVYGDGQIR
ncbi:MAG: glutamate-5-semialdehyde dehydrogenase [Clostridia bacterium]|nr:glutamate-5-semialdehyde dehydrogenase [Clostridia bacterium]